MAISGTQSLLLMTDMPKFLGCLRVDGLLLHLCTIKQMHVLVWVGSS